MYDGKLAGVWHKLMNGNSFESTTGLHSYTEMNCNSLESIISRFESEVEHLREQDGANRSSSSSSSRKLFKSIKGFFTRSNQGTGFGGSLFDFLSVQKSNGTSLIGGCDTPLDHLVMNTLSDLQTALVQSTVDGRDDACVLRILRSSETLHDILLSYLKALSSYQELELREVVYSGIFSFVEQVSRHAAWRNFMLDNTTGGESLYSTMEDLANQALTYMSIVGAKSSSSTYDESLVSASEVLTAHQTYLKTWEQVKEAMVDISPDTAISATSSTNYNHSGSGGDSGGSSGGGSSSSDSPKGDGKVVGEVFSAVEHFECCISSEEQSEYENSLKTCFRTAPIVAAAKVS